MAVLKYLDQNAEHYLGTEIPHILYKFAPINEYTLSILINRQIYFSSPSSFNDPFDCFIPIRYDLLTDVELIEFNLSIIKRLYNVDDEGAQVIFSKLKKEGVVRKWNSLQDMSDWQVQQILENVVIFCLTKNCDNFLMWSHYARNHTGICIGYSSIHLHSNTGAGLGEVKYCLDLPEMKPSPVNQMNELIGQVLTKADCWKYENEYRLAYFEKKSLFDIQPEAIKELIFGCKTSKEDINTISKLIRNDGALKHIKMFMAIKEPYSFKVTIQELQS